MIAGDSEKERDIKLARGFPNIVLQKDEIVTTDDVLNLIGAQVGDTIKAEYDLFQLLSPDFVKLKQYVFEFDQLNSTMPQGEAILDFL